MQECMNGSDGTVRHRAETEALYRVQTSESFAESTWCGECLFEYIGSGMGINVEFVKLLRPLSTQAERDVHEKVLGTAIAVEQP